MNRSQRFAVLAVGSLQSVEGAPTGFDELP
jgi:hypothetical protein